MDYFCEVCGDYWAGVGIGVATVCICCQAMRECTRVSRHTQMAGHLYVTIESFSIAQFIPGMKQWR